jgi:hypothetical protein
MIAASIFSAYFSAYFHTVENQGSASIADILVACGFYGIPTFLVLLPFWKRALYRWLVWIGCTALWTWFFIYTERHFLVK